MVSMPLFQLGRHVLRQLGITTVCRAWDARRRRRRPCGAILQGANRTSLSRRAAQRCWNRGRCRQVVRRADDLLPRAIPERCHCSVRHWKAWPKHGFIQAYGLTDLCA